MRLVNLYGWVDSSPLALWDGTVADPVGPLNDAHLLWACQGASHVIAAWGQFPKASTRATHVVGMRFIVSTSFCTSFIATH